MSNNRVKESRPAPFRSALLEKVSAFFTAPPSPAAAFALGPTAWSGVIVSGAEKKVRAHATFPLGPGLVEPRFDGQNIQEKDTLTGRMRRELARLGYSGEKAACLLPDACLKVFVFSFESLPLSEKERARLFLWRARKQLPLPAEGIRLAYQVMKAKATVRVLASLARVSVLAEYEGVFRTAGIKVGILTTPTLSLLNLIDWEKEKDFLLVHVDLDSTSLVAVSGGQLSLFRLKPNLADAERAGFGRIETRALLTEIENTIHFFEDREKRSLGALWLHASSADFLATLQEELEGHLPFPVKQFQLPHPFRRSATEEVLLVPLFGQLP